jgi:Fe-S-cluster containining protein
VQTFADLLPAIYQRLLPDFFAREALVEEKATCNDCAMCDKSGGGAAGVTYFRPDTKCCTFQPHLPNYLVGAILRDGDPALAEGARRVRARIDARIGVTPQWLAPGRKYSLLLDASRLSAFGRSTALRCSFFEPDGGLCTIWKHRDGACSTFFCKHLGGADGKAFWVALESWLTHVERRLAEHAARTLAPELEEPMMPRGQLTREDVEELPPPDADYASYWGAWLGREADFYARAFDVVAALDRDAFLRIVAGEEGAGRLAEVEATHAAATAPRLAERLVLNPELVMQPVDGGVIVTTYSRYESMMLSDALHEVLREFTVQEPVSDVLARLHREHEIELPDGLLVSLQQMRVVVPVTPDE